MKKLIAIFALTATAALAGSINLADLGIPPQPVGATWDRVVYSYPDYGTDDPPIRGVIRCDVPITEPTYTEVAGVTIRDRNRKDIEIVVTVAEIEAVSGKPFGSMTTDERGAVVEGLAVSKLAAALGIELP